MFFTVTSANLSIFPETAAFIAFKKAGSTVFFLSAIRAVVSVGRLYARMAAVVVIVILSPVSVSAILAAIVSFPATMIILLVTIVSFPPALIDYSVTKAHKKSGACRQRGKHRCIWEYCRRFRGRTCNQL